MPFFSPLKREDAADDDAARSFLQILRILVVNILAILYERRAKTRRYAILVILFFKIATRRATNPV